MAYREDWGSSFHAACTWFFMIKVRYELGAIQDVESGPVPVGLIRRGGTGGIRKPVMEPLDTRHRGPVVEVVVDREYGSKRSEEVAIRIQVFCIFLSFEVGMGKGGLGHVVDYPRQNEHIRHGIVETVQERICFGQIVDFTEGTQAEPLGMW